MGNNFSTGEKYKPKHILEEKIITQKLIDLLNFYIIHKKHFVGIQEKSLYKHCSRLLPIYSIRCGELNNRIRCILVFFKDILSNNFPLSKYYNQEELEKKAVLLYSCF